jgi:hypothetical protein
MVRTLPEILADLRAFRPVRGDWLPLDELSGELWEAELYSDAVEELLTVFERFPEDDGAGVFWTILHGLESLTGYEPALVRSVQRQPSQFGVLMVGRLLNGGQTGVGGVQLLGLLESVATSPSAAESVRQLARDFAEHHRASA